MKCRHVGNVCGGSDLVTDGRMSEAVSEAPRLEGGWNEEGIWLV